MAEASDRPAGGSPGAAEPTARFGPAAPPPAPETYRPLSGLAMTGFAVAALYTVIIIGGGIISFVGQLPFVLPVWTFLIPIVGFVLSLLARKQVRESEGVLGGAALANWGLGLCVGVGLGYSAYAAGTYFAVRQQASTFVNGWFDRIRQGQLERAFVLTLRPPRIEENDPALRGSLESIYNAPGERGMPGKFTHFCQSDYARLIYLAGDKLKVEPQGVREWVYEKGGYRFRLVYRLHTPIASSSVQVTVHSQDTPGTGREWYVDTAETGTLTDRPTKLTPEGEETGRLMDEGRSFVQAWLNRMAAGDIQGAYLETLAPADRSKAARGVPFNRLRGTACTAGGLGIAAVEPAPARELREGLEAFRTGAIVKAEPKKYFSPAQERPQVLEDIRKGFDPAVGPFASPNVGRIPYRLWERDGDVFRVRDELQLRGPRYMADAEMVISCVPPKDGRPAVWRLEEIDLVRGRIPQATRGPGPGPGF